MKRFLPVLAAALAIAVPAAAHRGHSSLSVVEIDSATGAVTVTHRMAAHDAEPALRDIAPAAHPNLDDPAAMRAMVAHAADAFRISTAAGKPLALRHVTTDLSGDDVRLIFAGQLPDPSEAAFLVDSGLLEASHADQENQVNVRRDGVTRTLLFRRGTAAQYVSFRE